MKIIVSAASALTLAAFFAGTASPAEAFSSRGQCYNHVISSCNATSNHPQSCAVAGMDACDVEFAASVFMHGLQFMMSGATPPRRARSGEALVLEGEDRVLRRAELMER
ncbi:MAG: hypothetical protein ACK4LQ_13165 [Pararhodobacter sp.]